MPAFAPVDSPVGVGDVMVGFGEDSELEIEEDAVGVALATFQPRRSIAPIFVAVRTVELVITHEEALFKAVYEMTWPIVSEDLHCPTTVPGIPLIWVYPLHATLIC
jgi:hypothetical protein